MAGLVDTAMTSGAQKLPEAGTAATASATGYDASMRSINAPTDTVAGQLNSILSKGSSYLDRAQAGAMEKANARGLANSSIAAGAGEAAAIDAALPIAKADADAYNLMSRDNQTADNNAMQFTAGERNKASQVNAIQANDMAQIGMKADAEKGLISARTAGSKELQEQKSTLDQQADIAKGRIEEGLIGKREEAEGRLAVQKGGIEEGLIGKRTEAESRLQSEKEASDKRVLSVKNDMDVALQNLRGTQANDLAATEATYRTLIQGSASAASAFSDASKTIAQINQNPDMGPDAKAAAVDKQIQMLKASLAVSGAAANVDFTDLLEFH